jgi:hypothetical protein
VTGLLDRPQAPAEFLPGLLRKEQFQIAYVTNDLDRACETFGQRYGIGKYDYIHGEMPRGGKIDVALAWFGGTCYEIVQARGPEAAFYNAHLPTGEFAIRFHHLGFLIHERTAWEALEREFRDGGWTIAFETSGNGFMDAYYVEAPELGHYLEYMYPLPAGLDFLKAVPVN